MTNCNIRSRLSGFHWLMGSLVIAVVFLAAIWIDRRHDGRKNDRSLAQSDHAAPGTSSHTGRPATSARDDRFQNSGNDGLRGSSGPETVVQVERARVLATVNGRPLRLEHLVPVAVEFGGGTVAMKKRVFRSRLNRAIEAELVFQEATAKGIEFSNRQWARLDRIEPQHEANLAELAPHGISWDSLSEGQVDLERRLMEATLLRQNLVAADTGEAPSPDRDAQAAYEAALREMMTHLRSAAEIDISNIDG